VFIKSFKFSCVYTHKVYTLHYRMNYNMLEPTLLKPKKTWIDHIFKKRRLYFIIPLILAIPVYPLKHYHVYDLYNDVYYMSVLSVLFLISLFINVKHLSVWAHSKPIYFEDLVIEAMECEYQKEKFQRMFRHMMNVIMTIGLAVMINYILYESHQSSLSRFEILGFIGGCIQMYKIYANFQNWCGKVILKLLKPRKDKAETKEKERRKSSLDDVGLNEITPEILVK